MERISHEDHDQDEWVCLCGNTACQSGFATCDRQGREMEPLIGSAWEDLYICLNCGRIIEQANRWVVGWIEALATWGQK